MPLRLHVAAHDAEGEHRLAVAGDEAGDDRVERALAGREALGWPGSRSNRAPRSCRQKPESVGDHARAEADVVALDQRDGIEILVDHGQVTVSPLARRGSPAGNCLPARPGSNKFQALPGVGGGDERGIIHVGEARIGVEAGPVLVDDFFDLDQGVQVGGRVVAHGLEVEIFKHLQHLQHGQPLAVGRQFPDVVAAVADAHGRDPFGLEVGEVAFRKKAAHLFGIGDNSFGQLAAVKSVAP